MKYGESYKITLKDIMTGEQFPSTAIYKRVEWHGYHTNDEGDGLWADDKQIIGTCDFTVRGCKTEKSAKAKIRKLISERY